MQLHLVTASHANILSHVTPGHVTWRLSWISSAPGTNNNSNSDFMIGFMYIIYYMDPILLVLLVSLIGSLSHPVWVRLGDVNCAIKMLVSANGDICHTRAPTHPNISTNEHFTYGTALKLTPPTLSFQIVSNGMKIILQCVLISAENVSIRDHNFF